MCCGLQNVYQLLVVVFAGPSLTLVAQGCVSRWRQLETSSSASVKRRDVRVGIEPPVPTTDTGTFHSVIGTRYSVLGTWDWAAVEDGNGKESPRPRSTLQDEPPCWNCEVNFSLLLHFGLSICAFCFIFNDMRLWSMQDASEKG
jgi:hypothetical protein